MVTVVVAVTGEIPVVATIQSGLISRKLKPARVRLGEQIVGDLVLTTSFSEFPVRLSIRKTLSIERILELFCLNL